jgi:DNA recombination protein RmuC
VIPVSPSTLHAYLLVLVLGFKGMQIEEHAREVMAYVAQLGRDFDRFKEDFELVGTHLGRAQSKYADAEKRAGKFELKLERATESETQQELPLEAQELPRALDAA